MSVACSFTSRIIKCEPGDKGCVVGSVGTVAGDCALTGVSTNSSAGGCAQQLPQRPARPRWHSDPSSRRSRTDVRLGTVLNCDAARADGVSPIRVADRVPCHPRRRLRRLADGAPSPSATACEQRARSSSSIRIQGSTPNEPANFADVGETVSVSGRGARRRDAGERSCSLSGRQAWAHFPEADRPVTWQAPARPLHAGECGAAARSRRTLRTRDRPDSVRASRLEQRRRQASRLGQGSRRHGAAVPARFFRLEYSRCRLRHAQLRAWLLRDTADERQQVQDNRSRYPHRRVVCRFGDDDCRLRRRVPVPRPSRRCVRARAGRVGLREAQQRSYGSRARY